MRPIQSIPYLCCWIKNSPGEVGSWQQIQSDFQTVIRKKKNSKKRKNQHNKSNPAAKLLVGKKEKNLTQESTF
jgi:2-oxoglutarate dehydrogenase complex dehydrogenase (E1) component-like enzyme